MVFGTEPEHIQPPDKPVRPAQPPFETLDAWFADAAARRPHAIALAFYGENDLDAPALVTYRELNGRVERLAERLAGFAGTSQLHVGLLLSHSIELVVATLAVLRIGGVFVPLDPNFPDDRIGYIVEDSGVAVVLTSAAHAHRHHSGTPPALLVDADPIEPSAGSDRTLRSSGRDAAYILYTSGTTGRPKGVIIDNDSITQQVMAVADLVGFRQGDSCLLSSGIAFDIWVDQLFLPLLLGGTLVLASPGNGLIADSLSAILARSGVNHIFQTPTVWRSLLDQGWVGAPFLRALAGGEAMPVNLARDLLACCQSVYNLYGPTEATICTIGCRVEQVGDVIPLGHPLANVEIRILDSNCGPVPDGEWGELWLGGPLVGRGYHNLPELTAERFRPDPIGILPDCRFYRTGDRVRQRPDGMLEFDGRFDDQIKINGVRIELQEIEASINSHPAVGGALVLTRARADGSKFLVGYVVPFPGNAPQAEEIRRYLADRLMAVMVPEQIVVLDKWPIGPTGKVARDRLPVPRATAARSIEPAQTDEQTARFLQVASEILRRPIRDGSVRFIDLGGTSLEAMLLIARAKQLFGTPLDLSKVLGEATLAELAATLNTRPELAVARPVDTQESPSLSFAEERFWWLSQLHEDPALFNITFTCRLEPAADFALVRRAWVALVERHEALRTTYVSDAGLPRARVHTRLDPEIEHRCHSCSDEAEVDVLLTEEAAQERARPFDLERGPLSRVLVVDTRTGRTDIVVTLHHIIADGWSVNILLADLVAAIDALRDSGRVSWSSASVPSYRVATALSRRRWEQHGRKRARSYWREHLKGGIPWLDLPADRPLERGWTSDAAVHERHLAGELVDRLATTSRNCSVTTWTLLLGSLYALIHRQTLAPDIVIGNAVHGRSLPQDARIVGAFLNVLPVRVKVDGGETFRTLLRRVHETLMVAYEHQEGPVEAIASAGSGRPVSDGDAIQVYFNMLDFPLRSEGSVQATLGSLVDPVGRFDLTFYVQRLDDGLGLNLVHSLRLFHHTTGGAIADQWLRLIEQVVSDPDRPISSYRLLGPAPVAEVPESLSHGRRRTIADTFSKVVATYPNEIALHDGHRQLTYRQLDCRARALARKLQSRVGSTDGAVGLYCGHNASMVIAILGCALAGILYVPIDPRHPSKRTDHVIDDSGAQLIIATADQVDPARQLADRHGIDLIVADCRAEPETAGDVLPETDPAAPAYILYTSGSTGSPKGVLQSQENVVHHAVVYAASVDARPGRRLALIASYAFDAAVMDLFGALLSGSTLHVIDITDDFGLSDLADRLRAARPHVFHATPTVFRHLMKMPASAAHLWGIDIVVLGGEPANRSDLTLFRSRFAPHAVLINGFGPTESTMALQARYPLDRVHESEALAIGYAVANTEILLEDGAQRDNEVVGEIVVRSRHVALGYWRRPDETARAFGTQDGEPAIRIYRTGDFGRRLPNGEIVHIGRRDDQVKLRGQRIELGEIEAVVRQFPGLDEATCVLRGGDAPMIVAIVTGPLAKTFVTKGRDWLAKRLPAAMVPGRIVAVEALPRTATGKVDRGALAARRFPDMPARAADASPTSSHLELVREIWSRVLGIETALVQATFFDLGGDSLALARVQAELRQRTGFALPLRQLTRLITAEDIAAHLDQLASAESGDVYGSSGQ